MAKVQIKSEKLTPFGGIFSIMEQFDECQIVDSVPHCSHDIGMDKVITSSNIYRSK